MTCALKISPNAPKGFNRAVTKVLGLIISNLLEVAEEIEPPLQEILMFCDRADIAKPCSNMQRMVVDPSENVKHVPAWYHLGTTRMLHWRFEAEKGVVCSLEWFRKNTPLDIVCSKSIGKVINIMNEQAAVKCLLTKPLGVNTPQDFEKDDDSVYYVAVYYTSIFPKLVKVGRGWK